MLAWDYAVSTKDALRLILATSSRTKVVEAIPVSLSFSIYLRVDFTSKKI
jgi:hypothetical protein